MPFATPPQARIHYELFGPAPTEERAPVLLLAPGGLRSRVGLWRHTHEGLPRNWPDPTVELARARRVVAMDQRNAGLSQAPVTPADGWDSFAADQLGLLDQLGIERFHVLGACIGSSFALRLAELAPDRVVSATLQQPIGWTPENAPLRSESFEAWLRDSRIRERGATDEALAALEHNLYGGEDFVFSVSRDFVRATRTPLLILAGDDVHHPRTISQELARLAPHARYVEHWRGAPHRAAYLESVLDFLEAAEARRPEVTPA